MSSASAAISVVDDKGVAKGGQRIGRAKWLVLTLAVIILALAPFYLSDAMLSVAGKALIAGLLALAFNLLFGQAGMLSFGHAAYYGLGAFAAIHAMRAVEKGVLWLPTPLVPLSGALVGLIAGALAGIFAGRRTGVYFAMVTLALAEFFYVLAPNLHELFGGESGLSSYRAPFLMINFGRESHVYILILGWFVVSALLIHAFTRTLFGRLAIAMRESETRLPALGYNVFWTKVVLFGLSGLFAGIAGSLLSLTNESANYVSFEVGTSAGVVLQTFIGGSSVFLGPVVGAVMITFFGFLVSDLSKSWLLYQGLIFITVMLLAPKGIASLVIDAANDISRSGMAAARRLLVAVVAIAFIGFGVVMLIEILSMVVSQDYQGVVQRSGNWAPVRVFWRAWQPLSFVTWVLPIVSFAAGVVLLRRISQVRPEVAQ